MCTNSCCNRSRVARIPLSALAPALGIVMLFTMFAEPVFALSMRRNDVVSVSRLAFVKLLDDSRMGAIAMLAFGMLLCALHVSRLTILFCRHCRFPVEESRSRVAIRGPKRRRCIDDGAVISWK